MRALVSVPSLLCVLSCDSSVHRLTCGNATPLFQKAQAWQKQTINTTSFFQLFCPLSVRTRCLQLKSRVKHSPGIALCDMKVSGLYTTFSNKPTCCVDVVIASSKLDSAIYLRFIQICVFTQHKKYSFEHAPNKFTVHLCFSAI